MSGGVPLVSVVLLRVRPSYPCALCANVAFRVLSLPEYVMMYASFWATLFGFTHASNEYSPVPCASCAIFRQDEVEACALPPAAKVRPQPPAQATPLLRVRSAAGLTPLESSAMLPVPVSNMYFATMFASYRAPPEASVPCGRVRAFETTRDGSMTCGWMLLDNAVNAANIVAALAGQSGAPPAVLGQQWCWSLVWCLLLRDWMGVLCLF